MIHSHNINNTPQYETTMKNKSIFNELKKVPDIHLWQVLAVCWSQVDTNDNWRSKNENTIRLGRWAWARLQGIDRTITVLSAIDHVHLQQWE